MGWPVDVGTITLWRNDRWQRTWPFFEAPPIWESGHAYVVGVIAGDYLANSTVRVQNEDGTWSYYTCIEAHTSGTSFDATKWEMDPEAKGPPIDLSSYGDSVAGQLRHSGKQDEAAVASLDLSLSDLAGGQITAKATQALWDAIDADGKLSFGFDIEIRDSGGRLPQTVIVGKISAKKDWTHG